MSNICISERNVLLLFFVVIKINLTAQENIKPSVRFKDGLKIYLNDDSTKYIKATGLAQIWLRYNENNPGSTIYGTEQKQSYDVGVRRMRYQVLSQVNKKVFFYSQIGVNSVNNMSIRKTPIFFHDVTAEYAVLKNYFTVGLGINGYNGVARYTSSGVGNILGLDLPIVQETTNDVTDQFVRKNGVFAKGKIKSFDYRVSVSNPFPIQNSLSTVATLPATGTNAAYFSTRSPKFQYQGYFIWQFLDKESNQLPYMTGSYLGKKRVFNIGSGFCYQDKAMWYRDSNLDTISIPLQQFGVDVFFDYYLNKEKQNAVTFYSSYLNYDFGPNFIRNAGVMNPTNQTNSNSSFNGTGNSMPLYGTGQVIYTQCAYLFKRDLLKNESTLQPYTSVIYANYEKLKSPLFVYDIGINWIQNGQNSKISLDYQSRPIYNTNVNGEITETKSARRGALILQYQVLF